MSQFFPAFDYSMQYEDPKRKYAAIPDDCPENCAASECFAISGINSGEYPEQFKSIVAIPQPQRGPAVASFYRAYFWDPMGVGGLGAQPLANRVYDEGVNGGQGFAVELLQRAIGLLRSPVAVDGALGPLTREAANLCDPEAILAAYRTLRKGHYQDIIDSNPAKYERYAQDWLVRAEG